MVSYEGIFLDFESVQLVHILESKQLSKVNDVLHCTFKYRPTDDEIFDEIVGKEFELALCGYANDGQNSGFQLELPEELIGFYINYDEDDNSRLKIPHITASLSENGKAMNTKKLNFQPIDKVMVKGCFGYWVKNNGEEYLSFEPQKKEDVKVAKKS